MGENELPPPPKAHAKIIVKVFIGIVVPFLIIASLAAYRYLSTPDYSIISSNSVLVSWMDNNFNTYYNFTVYAVVAHSGYGADELPFISSVTRPDLSVCTKECIVDIPSGSQTKISFFFSNSDLDNQIPIQYTINAKFD